MKKTIAMKDDMINGLRMQLQDMTLKSDQLEKLIERQREVNCLICCSFIEF